MSAERVHQTEIFLQMEFNHSKMITSMKHTILMKRYANIKRFIFYAAECCQAIILELNELVDCPFLSTDKEIFEDKKNSISDWQSRLVNVTQDLEEAKIKTTKMLVAEDSDIELFKSIPLIHKQNFPSIFSITELFYQIGYYHLVNDPIGLQYKYTGVAQKLSAIRQLENFLSQILRGLNSVKYLGVWKTVGIKFQQSSKDIPVGIYEDISLLVKTRTLIDAERVHNKAIIL